MIDHSLSALSLADDDQALFFGTDAGQSFREWAVERGGVDWALNAMGDNVVVDQELDAEKFVAVWEAVGTATPEDAWSRLVEAGLTG